MRDRESSGRQRKEEKQERMIKKNRLSRTRRLDWKGLSNPFGKKITIKGRETQRKGGKKSQQINRRERAQRRVLWLPMSQCRWR